MSESHRTHKDVLWSIHMNGLLHNPSSADFGNVGLDRTTRQAVQGIAKALAKGDRNLTER